MQIQTLVDLCCEIYLLLFFELKFVFVCVVYLALKIGNNVPARKATNRISKQRPVYEKKKEKALKTSRREM